MSVATDLQTVVVTTVVESDSVSTSIDSQATVVVQTSGGDTVVTELQGSRGLSAYEIAVANGFVGTETEWLTSLQGSGSGASGSGTTQFQAIATGAMSAGIPVAIDRATSKLVPADATYKPNAFVVGVLAVDANGGFLGTVEPELLTLADWTAATGSQQLAAGQVYFLAATGGLTTIPPGAGANLVIVGTALNATTLLIEPQPPIQL